MIDTHITIIILNQIADNLNQKKRIEVFKKILQLSNIMYFCKNIIS